MVISNLKKNISRCASHGNYIRLAINSCDDNSITKVFSKLTDFSDKITYCGLIVIKAEY